MKNYLGVKKLEAEPMKLVDAEELLRRKIKPGNEDGYLVKYEDGYMSWSPKDVFEKAYRTFDNLTFGLAVEALKQGKKVARKVWNGKRYVFIQEGSVISSDDARNKHLSELGQMEIKINSHIDMKAADGSIVIGWLASQTDVLAEDWEILD